MIATYLYESTTSGGWRNKGDNSVTSVDNNPNNHSERNLLENFLYTRRQQSSVIFLLQNAYPCDRCHQHFIGRSLNGTAIIMKITANNGKYSSAHNLGNSGGIPAVIYYFNGRSKMVHMSSRGQDAEPPQGFPAHEDVSHYWLDERGTLR